MKKRTVLQMPGGAVAAACLLVGPASASPSQRGPGITYGGGHTSALPTLKT